MSTSQNDGESGEKSTLSINDLLPDRLSLTDGTALVHMYLHACMICGRFVAGCQTSIFFLVEDGLGMHQVLFSMHCSSVFVH